MTFYERLKTFMKSQKMTSKELLERLDITSANLTFWKQGTLPRVDMAIRIAKIFGTTVEYLVTGSSGDGYTSEDVETMYKLRALSPENRNAVLTLLDALYKQQDNPEDAKYS